MYLFNVLNAEDVSNNGALPKVIIVLLLKQGAVCSKVGSDGN